MGVRKQEHINPEGKEAELGEHSGICRGPHQTGAAPLMRRAQGLVPTQQAALWLCPMKTPPIDP